MGGDVIFILEDYEDQIAHLKEALVRCGWTNLESLPLKLPEAWRRLEDAGTNKERSWILVLDFLLLENYEGRSRDIDELLKNFRPTDWCYLDEQLSHLGGFVLARCWLGVHPEDRDRIVILTGQLTDTVEARLRALGWDYLGKGIGATQRLIHVLAEKAEASR